MERDFLGLNTKNHIVVKEEIFEARCDDSGFGRSSGVPCLFPTKVSALSKFSSVKPEQDEKQSKNSCNHFLGRMPVSVLPSPAAAGGTEQWIKKKASAAQLTIFYGGAVNVFEDITPEKAKALIFMAGKGGAPSSYLTKPKLSPGDRSFPNSGHPTRISASSHPTDAADAHPSAIGDEIVKVEPPKIIPSACAVMSAAVPHARKASLARFLEKRKERVMNAAAPYMMNKKATPEWVAPAISGADSNSGKETFDDA